MTIHLIPKKMNLQGSSGKSLLQVLEEHHIPIGNSCSGKAACGTCRVTVLEGGESLSPENRLESLCRIRMKLKTQERLACQIQTDVSTELKITTSYW